MYSKRKKIVKHRKWSEFWREMYYEKNLMGTNKDPFERKVKKK